MRARTARRRNGLTGKYQQASDNCNQCSRSRDTSSFSGLPDRVCPFPTAAVALPCAALPTPTATVPKMSPGFHPNGVSTSQSAVVEKTRSGFFEMFRRIPLLQKIYQQVGIPTLIARTGASEPLPSDPCPPPSTARISFSVGQFSQSFAGICNERQRLLSPCGLQHRARK